MMPDRSGQPLMRPGKPPADWVRLNSRACGRKSSPACSPIFTDESRRSTVSSQVTGVGISSEGEFGANEWLVDEMYEQFKLDKNSVDKSWWPILEAYHPVDEATAPAAPQAAAQPAAPAEAPAPAAPPAPASDRHPVTAPIPVIGAQ